MEDYKILKLLHSEIKTGPYAHKTFEEKFWMFVDKKGINECWEFIGKIFPNGYGNFRISLIETLAHRISFLLYHNYLTPNMLVMHSCDNPSCVNPYHLKEGNYSDNSRDMISKNRGNPPRGEKSSQSVLSEKDVIEIRNMRKSGMLCKDISKFFPVSPTEISRVTSGARWGWLKLT